MKLHLLFSSIALLCVNCLCATASDKGKCCFTGGLDWGYSLTSNVYRHHNFDSPLGGRVDIKDSHLNPDSNGYLSANAGVKFLDKYSFVLNGGYYGLQSDRRVMVASAKALFYFKGYQYDSALMFLEAGRGFGSCMPGKGIFVGRLGGGYQIELSTWMRLQLTASLQFTSDHPASFYDGVSKTTIAPPELRRSDCYYAAVNIGIGLNF